MCGAEQVRDFVTFYIKVTMNEEGSDVSFATLETRLVSAGKVGVNGTTNKRGKFFAKSSKYFEKPSLGEKPSL